jgi:hypothetical protein
MRMRVDAAVVANRGRRLHRPIIHRVARPAVRSRVGGRRHAVRRIAFQSERAGDWSG